MLLQSKQNNIVFLCKTLMNFHGPIASLRNILFLHLNTWWNMQSRLHWCLKTDTGLTYTLPGNQVLEVNGVANIDSDRNLLLMLAHGVCDLLLSMALCLWVVASSMFSSYRSDATRKNKGSVTHKWRFNWGNICFVIWNESWLSFQPFICLAMHIHA
jgi:hypothetical protein